MEENDACHYFLSRCLREVLGGNIWRGRNPFKKYRSQLRQPIRPQNRERKKGDLGFFIFVFSVAWTEILCCPFLGPTLKKWIWLLISVVFLRAWNERKDMNLRLVSPWRDFFFLFSILQYIMYSLCVTCYLKQGRWRNYVKRIILLTNDNMQIRILFKKCFLPPSSTSLAGKNDRSVFPDDGSVSRCFARDARARDRLRHARARLRHHDASRPGGVDWRACCAVFVCLSVHVIRCVCFCPSISVRLFLSVFFSLPRLTAWTIRIRGLWMRHRRRVLPIRTHRRDCRLGWAFWSSWSFPTTWRDKDPNFGPIRSPRRSLTATSIPSRVRKGVETFMSDNLFTDTSVRRLLRPSRFRVKVFEKGRSRSSSFVWIEGGSSSP